MLPRVDLAIFATDNFPRGITWKKICVFPRTGGEGPFLVHLHHRIILKMISKEDITQTKQWIKGNIGFHDFMKVSVGFDREGIT